MRIVLITGASSGIGYATAKKLAPHYRLILCGRRKNKLEQLANELPHASIHILTFDVADQQGVFDAIDGLPTDWKSIDVLINNAGNAHGLARFQDAEIEDLNAMIDSNIKGVIYVTKACLPLMKHAENAHILNLSSIAGKQVYTNGTTYCASKWAVEALTKGMRLDFLPLGIKVTGIAPGAVETEFSQVRFKGDQEKAQKVYEGFDPLQAEDIANTIHFVLEQPPHVQLSDITILPKQQADGVTFLKNNL